MRILVQGFKIAEGEILLIRSGTTSVGLATAAIAKFGAHVISTSRPDSENLLLSSSADKMVVDTGTIAKMNCEMYSEGVHKVLELIETTTLLDSLKCVREGRAVCMTEIVGNKWSLDEFSPIEAIPSIVNLTSYDGGNREFMETLYMDLLRQIATGEMRVQVGKTFTLDQIVEVHRTTEENRARGKIVVFA
jgi:NADPH:quinone reductase-like Zn-dependent oxidoreductase